MSMGSPLSIGLTICSKISSGYVSRDLLFRNSNLYISECFTILIPVKICPSSLSTRRLTKPDLRLSILGVFDIIRFLKWPSSDTQKRKKKKKYYKQNASLKNFVAPTGENSYHFLFPYHLKQVMKAEL